MRIPQFKRGDVAYYRVRTHGGTYVGEGRVVIITGRTVDGNYRVSCEMFTSILVGAFDLWEIDDPFRGISTTSRALAFLRGPGIPGEERLRVAKHIINTCSGIENEELVALREAEEYIEGNL